MANTYDMINVAQSKLQQFVGQDTGSICEAEQRVICEYSPQSHRPCM